MQPRYALPRKHLFTFFSRHIKNWRWIKETARSLDQKERVNNEQFIYCKITIRFGLAVILKAF